MTAYSKPLLASLGLLLLLAACAPGIPPPQMAGAPMLASACGAASCQPAPPVMTVCLTCGGQTAAARYEEHFEYRERYRAHVEVHRRVTHRPPRVVEREPCRDCAVDLHATFLGCVYRDGRQIWQYHASNGVSYDMPTDRRGPNDMLRLFPNGRIFWVRSS